MRNRREDEKKKGKNKRENNLWIKVAKILNLLKFIIFLCLHLHYYFIIYIKAKRMYQANIFPE